MDTLEKLFERMRLQGLIAPSQAQLPALTTIRSPTSSADTGRETEKPVLLREDGQGRDDLIETLRFCWNTLHRFGKTTEDFNGVVKTWLALLAGYPTRTVAAAFEKYLRNRREFPTPADIIGIIEGRVKRDGAYYTRLCRQIQEGAFVTDDEYTWMRKYEGQVRNEWE